MKKSAVFLLLLLVCAFNAEGSGRKIILSGKTDKFTAVEIIKANKRPVVDYAAKELADFLGESMKCKVPVVEKATPGKLTIVLGEGELCRKAGIDVNTLPSEGFAMKRQGSMVFIAGRDSDTDTPAKPGFNVFYKRATLTGVYDFLERFTGARFFFPGPYGTVIPEQSALLLPEKIDITDAPDMSFRRFSLFGRPEEHYYGNYGIRSLRQALLPRLRSSENRISFTHGLNGLELVRRFGKSNPEFFALMADGKRYNDPAMKHTGQLCFSSGVREVIIQDAIAYFSGKPASARGMKRWATQTANGDTFCIMPQDGMYWCRCDKCKKVWDGKGSVTDPAVNKAISEFMYAFFKEVCDRMKQAGLKARITTMAYTPYNAAPGFALPPELVVQVAVGGLSGAKNSAGDTARLKMWYDRTGSRVTAWTYAMGKHMNKVIPGVPAMMPRNAAAFLKTNQKYLDGAYFESETDFFLFNYLNYYTVMRLMWNTSTDVEALLEDHFKAMFGKGAPFMAEFYGDLETNWTKKILGNTIETDLGPVTRVPSTREIWNNIYSPAKMAHYGKLFDRALQAASGDKKSIARINFIRREILGPIEKMAEKQQNLQKGMDLWVAHVPGSVWLRPFAGDVNKVNTKISLRQEKESLIIRADCEEPLMEQLIVKAVKRDDPHLFRDSVIEVLLNPSGDRKNYFQFGVNANGVLSDARCQVNGKPDFSWNSNAATRAGKEKDKWWMELTIPLKDLGKISPEGIPANFARNRMIRSTGNLEGRDRYYMWSIFTGTRQRGFHAIDSWGKIVFGTAPKQLMPNGSFTERSGAGKRLVKWSISSKSAAQIVQDENCFITGGRSLRFESDGKRNLNAGCRLPHIKPGKKYRLSYFLKTEKLQGRIGAGAWIYFHAGPGGGLALPRVRILGDNPWHRLSFEFTAPPATGKNGYVPTFGIWVWEAKGKAWFDEIRLEEL